MGTKKKITVSTFAVNRHREITEPPTPKLWAHQTNSEGQISVPKMLVVACVNQIQISAFRQERGKTREKNQHHPTLHVLSQASAGISMKWSGRAIATGLVYSALQVSQLLRAALN
jgi:hypothetical protein